MNTKTIASAPSRYSGLTLLELLLTAAVTTVILVVVSVTAHKIQEARRLQYQAGYLDGMSYVVESGITGSISCYFGPSTPSREGFKAGERCAERYIIAAGCKPNYHYQTSEDDIQWTPRERLDVILAAVQKDMDIDDKLGRMLRERFSDQKHSAQQ